MWPYWRDLPGEGEIRYVTAREKKILARLPLKILPVTATVNSAATVVAKGMIEVRWTGPNNDRDYVTLVAKGSPNHASGTYTYANKGGPAKLRAPAKPGAYELRYVTGKLKRVLARQPVEVIAE